MDILRPSQPHKRRRQIFSCNECRRRKLKCDRTVPCNRCVKSGCPEICSYKSHNQRPFGETSVEVEDDRSNLMPSRPVESRPQETPKIVETGQLTPSSSDSNFSKDRDSTISDLQKRVMMLESLLTECNQSSHPSPHGSFSIRSDGGSSECWPNQAGLRNVHFLKDFLHGKNSKTRFHGRSHWYPLCGQFDDVISTLETCKGCKDRGAAREYRSMKRLCSQIRENKNFHLEEHQSMILHAYIPPREIADQLVNFYLETFEYTYRILHVPTFRKEYNEFWVTPARENFHFMAKLYSILAISASHDLQMQSVSSGLSPLKDEIPIWLHCVQHWLDHAIENSKRIFDALQVHCLLTIARQMSSMDSNMVWISCGALVRTAISAGLHRNPNSFRAMTPFHAEMRRRLWATILELELQSSLDAGKQPFISCGDYDCDLPSNFNDDDITNPDQTLPNAKPPDVFTRTSFLIALSKSLPTRIEVAKLANGLHTNISYHDLLRLSAQITRSFRNMPRPHSDMGPATTTIPYPAFSAAFFDFLTRRFLLVIHRQVAIMGSYDSKYHFSRRICLDSSLTMLSHFGVSLTSGDEDAPRGTPLAAYCGGMFRNEFINAALSICVEMLMGKVDAEVLGCSIHDRPLSTTTSPGGPFQADHLLITIEKALKTIEQWISEGHGECSKIYLCLYTAFSSVKSRYANEDPQTAVATALSESVDNCKMLLLQKTSGIQVFDGAVVQNDTPDSNISSADGANACNDMQVRCLAQSTFPGDILHEDSEWDNVDSWDIDWEF